MKYDEQKDTTFSTEGQVKSTFFAKTVLFAFGVSSILGWNAILTSLDYFSGQFTDYEVNFDLPIPFFFSTCLTGFILPKLSLYLSLTFRLAWSLIMVCIILVLMPVVSELLPNYQGFYTIMILVFFLGAFSSIQQNSAIAIASLLGGEHIHIFWIGSGFSGTIICIFRMICLILLKDDLYLSCLVYFCVSACWNIFSIILYFQFKKTIHYEYIMKFYLLQEGISTNTTIEREVMIIESQKTEKTLINSDEKSIENKIYQINQLNIFQIVLYVNRITFPVSICIVLIYIQTFMMFPGMTLEKKFSSEWSAWGPTLLILTYNVGDTVGKYIGGFRQIYNEIIQIIILFMRFGFFITFYMIVVGNIQPYWFTFVNLFLFALTNGFNTSGFMHIGPEKVEDYMKEKVGFVQGFSVVFGIMIGTFLALTMKNIKPTN